MVLRGVVCVLVAAPLLAGCKKKETEATGGSATPTGSAAVAAPAGSGSAVAAATGSGSATAGSGAAAGSAAPAEIATPWAADTAAAPATSKVTGKRNGNDEGTFDRAIYFKATDKYGSTSYQLHLSNGCEKFSCAHYVVMNGGVYSSDKLSADCPSGKTMDITIGDGEADPKAGPVELDVSINGPSSGGGLSGDRMKGSSLTAVGDKEVKGKIAVKDGNSEAKGEFTAKNCGTIVIPKG